eukprot:Lithocolla_globosa_v1_NODE_1489_length_2538_cov_14.496979.p2 type:complete len:119 gc:universal NODE_1489_length_2538_cov_14.496979:427-783(+)
MAAVRDATVSGREVPNATIVMAVTESFKPRLQPRSVAKSLIRVVTPPIMERDTTKVKYPPKNLVGGQIANKTFHGKVIQCMICVNKSSGISKASRNCCRHDSDPTRYKSRLMLNNFVI